MLFMPGDSYLGRRALVGILIYMQDILMPIMDGLTATMRIRQHEREFGLKRTPIIMQTGMPPSPHQSRSSSSSTGSSSLRSPGRQHLVFRKY